MQASQSKCSSHGNWKGTHPSPFSLDFSISRIPCTGRVWLSTRYGGAVPMCTGLGGTGGPSVHPVGKGHCPWGSPLGGCKNTCWKLLNMLSLCLRSPTSGTGSSRRSASTHMCPLYWTYMGSCPCLWGKYRSREGRGTTEKEMEQPTWHRKRFFQVGHRNKQVVCIAWNHF